MHVRPSVACGKVCIYACICGPQSVLKCIFKCTCVCVCAESTSNVSGPVVIHTWSQLAVNEVPDKHAAAATRETIAHDPDTVSCSCC